jgi:DNA polymerase-1
MRKPTRTLLIDGDILIYHEAAAVEEVFDWGDDWWTLHGDASEAKERVDVWLEEVASLLEAEKTIVTLTGRMNWRKDVLPTYKANRKGKRKPVVYTELRRYVTATYKTACYDTLEADDVMGILATHPVEGDNRSNETIIVSADKDMRTVPGKLYNPNRPDEGIQKISEEEANRNHLIQALSGDSVDGYSGCPRIGPKTADKILTSNDWSLVVAAYEKAGLTEDDALVQARVARILRYNEFNPKAQEVKLWDPKCL